MKKSHEYRRLKLRLHRETLRKLELIETKWVVGRECPSLSIMSTVACAGCLETFRGR